MCSGNRCSCVRMVVQALVLLVLLLGASGCVVCTDAVDSRNVYIADHAEIGIIETRSNIDKSRIVLYDKDLNEIGSVPLDIAGVEQAWGNLPVVGTCVYVAPYGNFKEGQGHEVLQIDRTDLSVTPFDVDERVLNGAAASDRYVFAFNDLNLTSTISRCSKETGEVKKVIIPDDHVTSAIFAEGSLWVFAQRQGSTGEEEDQIGLLYQFSEELEKIGIYDVSACGSGQYRVLVHEGKLYFTSLEKAQGCDLRRVGVFDLVEDELSWIQLEKDYPSAMAVFDGKLLVSHCDVIAGRNTCSYLSVCDLAGGKVETRKLAHDVTEMVVIGTKLYMANSWERELYAYDANSFELEKSVVVSSMDDDYSYLSNIFSMNDAD